MIPRAGGCAGASVSIPRCPALLLVLPLSLALAGAGEPEGLTQVGGPFDDKAGGLLGRVGGFVLPPPLRRFSHDQALSGLAMCADSRRRAFIRT